MTKSQTSALLAKISGQSEEDIEAVTQEYPFAVPHFLLSRLLEGSYSHQALRQYSPDIRELDIVEGFTHDPTGEAELHPEASVLQAYPNRVAIYVTQNCLVYCRFCFRKDFVGKVENRIHRSKVMQAVEYVRMNSEVTDVLLSGGDPLATGNQFLLPILRELHDISHVKTIRIHSRAVSAAPTRIDDELVGFLAGGSKFWYYAHMNHPDDINHPEVIQAIRRLQRASVPVLNQCVLLRGVNDEVAILQSLMLMCYENRVIPYNLYVLDRVKGAGHFDVEMGLVADLYKSLGELPGPAQPALVFVDSKSRKHRYVNTVNSMVKEFLSWREI